MEQNDQEFKNSISGFFQIAETPDTFDELQLSPKEQQLLDAYDHLENLNVEIAILRTRNRETSNYTEKELVQQVDATRKELLDVKSNYTLRRKIIDNVLITDPCLKAVHSGASATLPERELLPRINRRDVLSIAHANVSAWKSKTMASIINAEAEKARVTAQNQELTKTLLSLVSEVKPATKEDIEDEDLRNQIQMLEEDMKVKRSQWRIMKSVVSGIVAGSGVDWVNNEELRDLVVNVDED